jgi:hypothetical protein
MCNCWVSTILCLSFWVITRYFQSIYSILHSHQQGMKTPILLLLYSLLYWRHPIRVQICFTLWFWIIVPYWCWTPFSSVYWHSTLSFTSLAHLKLCYFSLLIKLQKLFIYCLQFTYPKKVFAYFLPFSGCLVTVLILPLEAHKFLLFFDSTVDWTQGLELPRQELYHLSHSTSTLCICYFWDSLCLGWPEPKSYLCFLT